MGRVAKATGLAGAEAPEPPSRLGPSDGIPRAEGDCNYPTPEVFLRADRVVEIWQGLSRITLSGGHAALVHTELGAILPLMRMPASAIEARSDATPQSGAAEGESAASEAGDAQ